LLKEYASLYLIIDFIQKSFYNKYTTFDKLWKELIIRDPEPEFRVIMRDAIPYAEKGNYKKALELMKTPDHQVQKMIDIGYTDIEIIHKILLSYYFYKMKLEYRNNIDVLKTYNILNNYINNNIESFNNYLRTKINTH